MPYPERQSSVASRSRSRSGRNPKTDQGVIRCHRRKTGKTNKARREVLNEKVKPARIEGSRERIRGKAKELLVTSLENRRPAPAARWNSPERGRSHRFVVLSLEDDSGLRRRTGRRKHALDSFHDSTCVVGDWRHRQHRQWSASLPLDSCRNSVGVQPCQRSEGYGLAKPCC